MVVGHSAPSAGSVILQISRIAPQGRSRYRYSTRTWVEYIAVQGHKVCKLLDREVGALCPVPLPACRVELQGRSGSHEVYSLAQCRQRPPGRSRATRMLCRDLEFQVEALSASSVRDGERCRKALQSQTYAIDFLIKAVDAKRRISMRC